MNAKDPKWTPTYSVEEQFFGSDRKQNRLERKLKSSQDRSKFKKTDKKKFEQGIQQEISDKAGENLLRGRVLAISTQGYVVDCDGQIYNCQLRGLLKKEKTHAKNLVTVGDFVRFAASPDHEGSIAHVEPRTSYLSRADNLSRNREQLIAANVDQVLITVSLVDPPIKPSLIDRYIIAARKGKMEPVVVVNKIDLLSDVSYPEEIREEQRLLLEECREAYLQAGIPLVSISASQGEGIDQLKGIMKNRTSVFSGQSGTGKSSLINAVTGLELAVGETVRHTRKGAHTTTSTRLVPLDCGGFCLDTPGIKSFGVWELDPSEIEAYFTEIQEVGAGCKFPDCSHSHEKACAVIDAVQDGTISALRYASYVSLRLTSLEEHRRR